MNSELIRATTAQLVVKQLRDAGFEVSRLLLNTHLTKDWIDNEQAFISYADYQRLIINWLDVTGDDALGLKIGKKITPYAHSNVGYAGLSSKNLQEAIRVYLKYQDLVGQLIHVSLTTDKNDCLWHVDPLYPFENRVLVYVIEEASSNLYSNAQYLIDQEIELKELGVSYPRPKHAELYEKMFRCPIKFKTSRSYFRYDRKYLKKPIPFFSRSVHIRCVRDCEEMLKTLKKSDQFLQEIRNIILATPGHRPTADEAAKTLAMATRTMQRKLAERKTSFHKILDEIRLNSSILYLNESNLSIDEIAELVGFAETTSFRKAFFAWTGKSPSQYRKEMMRDSLP